MKKILLIMLTLLLTITMSAWAGRPTVYTSEVAMANLKEGDILAQGFSLTGDSENYIYFNAQRSKKNGTLLSEQTYMLQGSTAYGANCTMTDGTTTMTPSTTTVRTATPGW